MIRLSEQIYRAIKEDILSCKLLPGQVITQSELTKMYHASRTPTREALQTLISEGLIQVTPHLGYQVSPITLRDVYELFELRMLLEKDAAFLAAQRRTDADIREMENLAAVCSVHHDQQNFDEFLKVNRQFHIKVVETSKNQRLIDTLVQVMDDLNRIMLMGLDIRDQTHRSHDEHYGIVNAIREGNCELAEQIAARHSSASTQEVIDELLNKWGKGAGGQSAQVIRVDHRPDRVRGVYSAFGGANAAERQAP